jgi:ABC-type multidrug transport system fused ATPase/permease subunit
MSARIPAAPEPVQPSRVAVPLRPVLDDPAERDQTMTALAEPEPFISPVPTEAEPSGSAMIVFEDVTKVYEPGVTALDGVSFAIEKGEFVFVVGASGSGKSTVIRLLLKEIEPNQGRIVVGGRDLGRLKRSKVPLLRRNVGCVFQDFKLLPNRTATENIAYALRVQGQSSSQIRKKVPEVLNLVGLSQRADGQPRSRHVRRDHAAALPHQPHGHDDPHGHTRPRDGGQDAPPRHRARDRPARA